jgi:hypothetical protein
MAIKIRLVNPNTKQEEEEEEKSTKLVDSKAELVEPE